MSLVMRHIEAFQQVEIVFVDMPPRRYPDTPIRRYASGALWNLRFIQEHFPAGGQRFDTAKNSAKHFEVVGHARLGLSAVQNRFYEVIQDGPRRATPNTKRWTLRTHR